MGPLVTTEFLAGELGKPDLLVFDATKYLPNEPKDGRTEFLRAHIPGARYFDIDQIADQDTATAGAYHTADIPYWFDTLDHYNMFRTTRVLKPWDRTLIDRMSASLIAFAETGSPATADAKWPAWTATGEQKIEFGDAITVVKLDGQKMDWLAAHPAKPIVGAQPERIRPRD